MAFSSDPHPGTGLGVVMGRPRQGKTLLLESVARATGGFYFCGQEATEAESLRRLGEEYARYRQVAQPSHWRDWKEGIDALLALGDTRPLPVIIDSFPDLVAASPALPSVIHGALRHLDRPPLENRARLLLGGETAPVMIRLFAHVLAAARPRRSEARHPAPGLPQGGAAVGHRRPESSPSSSTRSSAGHPPTGTTT